MFLKLEGIERANFMFIGEYRHTIDSKRRVAIPAKFRRDLGSNVVITRGLDKSLLVYPLEIWKGLAEKLAALPIGRSTTRSFVRLMLAGAVEVEIDRLGRILVPDYLAAYAGLDKDLIVAGLYDRLEIWNEDHWERYKQESEKQTGDIAEKLGEMGVY